MKERGILFSGRLVRRLLVNAKTQTRRIVKPQPHRVSDHFERLDRIPLRIPDGWQWRSLYASDQHGGFAESLAWHCPYGRPGDRLWVKENFRLRADQDHQPPREDWWKSGAWYDADGVTPSGCGGGAGKLRPSIFMPRWASRITLEIVRVRVERLQDITPEDVIAEGVDPLECNHNELVRTFAALWKSVNGPESWDANPWVWVLTFERVARAEAA